MQILYDGGMIRQIRGKVLSVGATSAVIEVAGFGIEVHMSTPQALVVGKEAVLATHLAVKQDGMNLYGFLTEEDRDFFELVLSVSGVGPKTALSVLRRAPREALEGAIGKRDLAYLTKVVGLGKKSAEKMLVELSEKVGPHAHDAADGEVFDTLVALGYTEREARKALQNIPESAVGKDVRLKAALSNH
ncbi:MAG: Holliday junction branch migration protein RuvA [Candidatus Kaiserbacteria bacterium]|nr:Holliday junction branch migration protein RuvA [Candidatus Kaiserbacteria bacterium]